MLSIEQEILRVHGRAARALANQGTPLSFCTILKDENIYTPMDGDQVCGCHCFLLNITWDHKMSNK